WRCLARSSDGVTPAADDPQVVVFPGPAPGDRDHVVCRRGVRIVVGKERRPRNRATFAIGSPQRGHGRPANASSRGYSVDGLNQMSPGIEPPSRSVSGGGVRLLSRENISFIVSLGG